jgi:hypothetical protein
MFVPVYPRAFQGLVLDGTGRGCVVGASWIDAGKIPVLLDVMLTPNWDESALYQRLPIEQSVF